MSVPPKALKRLQKELEIFQKEPVESCIVRPKPDNMLEWYFVLHNVQEAVYKDGVYFGHIKLPNDYPFSPPVFKVLTPNGRFAVNTTICTTFSHYHKEEWSPKWTIQGMIIGLLSFMLDDNGSGVGSIKESNEKRIQYAKDSKTYNKNCLPELVELFPEIDFN